MRRLTRSRPAARPFWGRPLVHWLAGVILVGSGMAWARPPGGLPRPVDVPGSVRFAHSYGWLPVDGRRVVLWAGVEEPYLVDLASGCPDVRVARVAGVTTHQRRLSPRIDAFVADDKSCLIERIQPAGGSTLRALGVRRDQARDLPVLPRPTPGRSP